MTPADILDYPGLSEHERRIVNMRIRDGLRANVIAKRLGLSTTQVYSAICSAQDRVRGKRPPAGGRVASMTHPLMMDADWFPRQVAMVQALAHDQHDPTHQQRYLNGIAIVWGQAWADKVERAAEQQPTAR